MTTLQFATSPLVSSRREVQPRPASKPAAIAATRGESLLMRFARSIAQARIDWATGGRG